MKELLHDSIWRHRDLRLLLPAQALSAFGDDMTLIVLTLKVFDAGLGTWSIAGLLLCAALPVVLLGRVAGRLVDSVPFRTLAVVSALWQAGCCIGLAVATPLWATYALVLALQTGHAVAGPTWGAILPSIAPRDEVGRVVGMSQALNTVATVAAPATAGVLVGLLGFSAPLLVDAATFLLLAAAGASIRAARGNEGAGVQGASNADDGAGAFSLRSDRLLWPLVVGLCVMVLVGEVTNVVEVFLVRGALDAGPTAFGAVGAVLAVGVLAGSVIAGRTASDEHRAVRAVVAAIALALTLVGAGLAPSIWVFAVLWGGLGVANGVVNADASTLVLTRTPERSRGRVLARLNALVRGSALGAMALGGAAGAVLGPRATFVAAGALMAIVGAIVLLRIRRVLASVRIGGTGNVDYALTRSSTDDESSPRPRPSCQDPQNGRMATIRLRAPLSELAGKRTDVPVAGSSVVEVLRVLEREHPGLEGWILDERGLIREHVNVFVNGERGAEHTPVGERDRVHILPAITGG
jgi:MFS family permease/molybdopterin converting factor small subunit